MIDTGLNAKVVVVTGANHGIGAATAGALFDQAEVGQYSIRAGGSARRYCRCDCFLGFRTGALDLGPAAACERRPNGVD